ncbi:MAG: TetR/AcrR family transcriptional regulator [Acidimicrobiales bacterium]
MRQPSGAGADRGRPRTRLDPGVRRELILAAAETVFRGREPTEVTFEAVAEAADVSRALVYNYFGDRNGLLAAVYLRTLERLDDSLLAVLDPALSPAEQVRPLAAAYLEFAETNGSKWQALGSTGAVSHPSVQAARGRRVERLAALWGGTEPARIAARIVTVMLEAATVDWVEEGIGSDVVVSTVCQLLSAASKGPPTHRDGLAGAVPVGLPHPSARFLGS